MKKRSYPRRTKTDAGDIEFRLMSRADEAAVLDFAQKLPTHDRAISASPKRSSAATSRACWWRRGPGSVLDCTRYPEGLKLGLDPRFPGQPLRGGFRALTPGWWAGTDDAATLWGA